MNKVGNASLYYLQLVNVLSPMKIYTSTIMYETCGKASMGKHSDNNCTKNKKFCMFTEVMYGSNSDLAMKMTWMRKILKKYNILLFPHHWGDL